MNHKTFIGREVEPAERDPGPGWLRSRFMLASWPHPGVAACGRASCPVCGEAPIQCEALPPEPHAVTTRSPGGGAMARRKIPIRDMSDAELEAEASRRGRNGEHEHAHELRAYVRLRAKYGRDHHRWPPEAVAAELEERS